MQKKLSNKELVAAGHKFAANINADTPLIDMAKMVSALATQLDAALAAAAEACKQRDQLAAENPISCNIIGRLIGQYSAAGYHAVQNSTLLYDALQALKTPATDAYLNAVRAEAIINALDSCSSCCDTDCVMDAHDISYEDAKLRASGAFELHDGLLAVAAQLRTGNAGKDSV